MRMNLFLQVALDIEYHHTMLKSHLKVNPQEVIVGWYFQSYYNFPLLLVLIFLILFEIAGVLGGYNCAFYFVNVIGGIT